MARRFASVALLTAAVIDCAGVAPAYGQDARAAIPPALELPAGGLVFNGREKLVVDQEAMTLALDRIEITYRLMHRASDGPRSYLFAFPMPAIDMANLYGQGLAIPAFEPANPTNFVGFWTTVDGVAVEPDVDVRAFALGQADVTAKLRQNGLPLYPLAPGIADQLAALPLDIRRALDDANLIDTDVNPPQPLWTLRTVFHWRQSIAADATVAVRHHYKPIAGSAPWSRDLKDKAGPKYCLTAEDVEALDRQLAGGKAPTVYWVHYAPGHNSWLKGPSAKHVLDIERPSGLKIAATCATGSRTATDARLRIETDGRVDDTEIFVLFAE